jgi:Ca-activated chloride channel family protein
MIHVTRRFVEVSVKQHLKWTTIVFLFLALACRREPPSGTPASSRPSGANGSLSILAGSENESLQPILERFARQNDISLDVKYKGSVDIMLALQDPDTRLDAVWPAASIWIDLGDGRKRVKLAESTMRSPVVFGVKKSTAQRLGWIGKDVTVSDILSAAEAGRLRYMMTSATQSNSGASAYLGYLSSFSNNPPALTLDNLRDPAVTEKVRRLLSTVNRSAGSSGWLKDLFLEKFDQYDGMVNYESVVIEANRELLRRGREPLYAIYPVDGLAIADYPFAYVDRGDAKKEETFKKLQSYLLSPGVQNEILQSGRRVGLASSAPANADRATFNPDWGIDLNRVLTPIRYPAPEVLRQALTLYQTTFRKPSITVYCLDFSGSMRDKGEDDLKGAMRILLDQPTAERYLLQTSSRDVTIVIPFSDHPFSQWSVSGNGADDLSGLLAHINATHAEGGTDIFTPVLNARNLIRQQQNLEGYSPAVILMTDGKSENGMTFDEFQRAWKEGGGKDIPVYSITFGDADDSQLKEIAKLSSGRVFDGRTDLVRAFRQARGYN